MSDLQITLSVPTSVADDLVLIAGIVACGLEPETEEALAAYRRVCLELTHAAIKPVIDAMHSRG